MKKYFFIVLLMFIGFAIMSIILNCEEIVNFEFLGQIGDSFGTLTSLFTGLAFVGLIWTILLQQDSIKLQNKSLEKQICAYKADHERRSKQATIEFGHGLNKFADDYNKIIVNNYGNKVINISDLNDDAKHYLRDFLSFVEVLAVGVNSGVYDINIINRMYGGFLIVMRKKVDPYIDDIRDTYKTNTPFSEFQHMCDNIAQLRGETINTKGDIEHS